MKDPNGYGCVKHLSGSRRNPFAFVVTGHRKQIVKGYFPTKMDALAYQVEYWNTHGRTRLSEIALEELYAECLPAHRSYVSESTVRSYQSAYDSSTKISYPISMSCVLGVSTTGTCFGSTGR